MGVDEKLCSQIIIDERQHHHRAHREDAHREKDQGASDPQTPASA